MKSIPTHSRQVLYVQPGVAHILVAVYYTNRHEGRRYQVVPSLNFRSIVNAPSSPCYPYSFMVGELVSHRETVLLRS